MDNKRLVALRGATIAANNKASVVNAAVKLADRLYFKNGITDDDVVNIAISVTKDLTAYSAARAIRESGHDVPLFSCVEPKVNGGLENCIRLMITAYSTNPVRHIYLNGARKLRTDISGNYVIALDGPSGAGKSTVAKLVASKLKITYLDTGALYRALGLKCLNSGVVTTDGKVVEKCLKTTDVTIRYFNGAQQVLLDGKDVSGLIRTPDVSMAASDVSAIPYVREKLLDLQRGIASENSVILDGRDIGTVVLPTAEFKFFLTAAAEIRAKRRYDELIGKGQTVTYDEVFADVVKRDRNDSTRAVAPLKQAFDAVKIDSDGFSAEQVAEFIVNYVTEDL